MKFSSYFYSSVAATAAIIAHAVFTREQFYPIILFLVTSKISFVVMGNMAVASILLLGRISQHIFLGALREIEVEQLIERAKYTVTETCLALTVFRNDLSPPTFGLFGALLFVKAFHWLTKSRIDFLEQIMPVPTSTHFRLVGLICILSVIDIWVAHSCVQYTLKNGRSVLILFGFEFGLLVISVFNLVYRYILHIIDSRMTNGLVSKGFYLMLIDLICDGLRVITYVCFFCFVFKYYGLPLHIIREVYMAFRTFHKKLMSFIKYTRLMKNLDTRLEDATQEEITATGDCLICREEMQDGGKKLPCGHVFHLDCLGMWLQHQQSCPLCRADIPATATEAETASAVAAVNRANAAAAATAAAAAANNGVDAVEGDLNMHVDNAGTGTGTGMGVGVVNGVHDAAIQEARQLIDAIQDQNRGIGGGGGINSTISNDTKDDKDSLPCFYVVTASPSIEVRTAPSNSSALVRTIKKGSVVYVAERVEGLPENDSIWLQLPDGYMRERVVLFSVQGPPSALPFNPSIHLSSKQTSQALSKRATDMEDLLPQPAVSVPSSRQNQNQSSVPKNVPVNSVESNDKMGSGSGMGMGSGTVFGAGINANLKKDKMYSDDIDDEQSNRESSLNDNDLNINNNNNNIIDINNINNDNNENKNFNLNSNIDEITKNMANIDYDMINQTTAAARLLRNAFGDPGPDNKYNAPTGIWEKGDFKSVGSGWGVGTSLDKMIAMQSQMEHFASSLEGMHDTVTNCQAVLAQLVDDQVKQYQKIHVLRRAIANKSNAPGDYFFEFGIGRGGINNGMGLGPLNKNLKSSSTDSPCDSKIALNNSDTNSKVQDKIKDEIVNGSVDKLKNEKANEENKFLSLSTQFEISSTKMENDNIKVYKTPDMKHEVKDIKMEIKSILDHSSGATLYEQLLSTEGRSEYHTNEESINVGGEIDCYEDHEGEGKSEEGWHNYTPDSTTLFQNDEDEDTWRNMDPHDVAVSTEESLPAPCTIAASGPTSTFFSPSILKSVSSSMFSNMIDNAASGSSTSIASDIISADDLKTQSHNETVTTTAVTSTSTMDDIKELRAAKYRLNQQQDQKK